MRPPIDVLLVEDDARLAQLTERYLGGVGFAVTWVVSGGEALELVTSRTYDVVLLDLMLPGRDGIDVCRELRARSAIPVIMVTARLEVADRVLGLDVGADDYITKPFSSRELVSRIRAVVRRASGQLGPAEKVLQVGGLHIDLQDRSVMLEGRELPLTSYEFALLVTLAKRAGHVLTREQLLDLAHDGGAEEVFDRSIDVQISKLRQKLGDDARNPRYLKTVRGSGYLLVGAR